MIQDVRKQLAEPWRRQDADLALRSAGIVARGSARLAAHPVRLLYHRWSERYENDAPHDRIRGFRGAPVPRDCDDAPALALASPAPGSIEYARRGIVRHIAAVWQRWIHDPTRDRHLRPVNQRPDPAPPTRERTIPPKTPPMPSPERDAARCMAEAAACLPPSHALRLDVLPPGHWSGPGDIVFRPTRPRGGGPSGPPSAPPPNVN